MNTGKNLKACILLSLAVVFSVLVAANTPPEDPAPFFNTDPVYETQEASCGALYNDPEGDDGSMKIEWFVSTVSVKNQTWTGVEDGEQRTSYLNSSAFSNNQELICRATVDDDVDDEKNTSEEITIVKTFVPEVTGPSFQNYSSEHAFNFSAEILDKEGEDEIAQCFFEARDGEGNSYTENMSLSKDFGDSNQVLCSHSDISNLTAGFEVLENITVQVFANDSNGDLGNSTADNAIPNSPPLIYNILPEDDSSTSDSEVELEVNVMDDDGEPINVWFFNDSGATPQLLHNESGLSSGDYTSATWQDIPSLRTFDWYVKASDGFQNSTENLRFRNLVSSQYRVQTSFEYRYSAVMATENTTTVVPYRIRNTASEEKNLRTTTYGLNSDFASTGTSTTTYGLDSGESTVLNIRVKPDQKGNFDLQVETKNLDYDVTTSDTIKVNVRNPSSVAAEVPGLGVLQLLFMALFSSILFYSGRL